MLMLGNFVKSLIVFLVAVSVLGSNCLPAQANTDCQQLEGTWFLKEAIKPSKYGYYEHQLQIAVDGNCRLSGTWRSVTHSGTSSIYGNITGDRITFYRTGEGVQFTYIGRWCPNFAGGTFKDKGVWFMERQ
jgi:hypothetical protein